MLITLIIKLITVIIVASKIINKANKKMIRKIMNKNSGEHIINIESVMKNNTLSKIISQR